MLKLEPGEKRVLRGFAIAYRVVNRLFDKAGKAGRERGTISLGPSLIQADSLPSELADSIESFLLEYLDAQKESQDA